MRLALFIILFPLNSTSQPSAFFSDTIQPLPNKMSASSLESQPDHHDTEPHYKSLKARIAQLVLITLEGTVNPSVRELQFLQNTPTCGVVMLQAFSASSAASHVNTLRKIGESTPFPLLIGADLYRFPETLRSSAPSFIQLPSLLSIAAARNSQCARNLAHLIARQIVVMGFNFHLGPSLELAPTLRGAAKTVNTFGNDPQVAAEAGALFYQTFLENGLMYVPTGFPGGGANKEQKGAAVLTTPESLLLKQDILPYHEVIQKGVQVIHVGNTLCPTIDEESRPASISPAVISGLLRERLGFTSAVIAGPLDDEIIQSRYDPAEAAVQALLAGADILYFQGKLPAVERAIAKIELAVKEGRLDEKRLDESLSRVYLLKKSLSPLQKPLHEKKVAQEAGHKDLALASVAVERHAITLLKNDNNVLPLVNKVSTPVGITGTLGVDGLYTLLEKQLKPLAQQNIATARHIGEIQRFEIDRLTRHMSGVRTVICVLADTIRPETQAELITALKTKAPYVVVVHLGHPGHALKLIAADAVVLAYCNPHHVSQTIEAVADVLMGRAPVAILPIPEELSLRVGESRTFDAYEIVQVPAGRLPIQLSSEFPAGISTRYYPNDSIKSVEWDFGGKKMNKVSVVRSFDTPGKIPSALTITDVFNEKIERSFMLVIHE